MTTSAPRQIEVDAVAAEEDTPCASLRLEDRFGVDFFVVDRGAGNDGGELPGGGDPVGDQPLGVVRPDRGKQRHVVDGLEFGPTVAAPGARPAETPPYGRDERMLRVLPAGIDHFEGPIQLRGRDVEDGGVSGREVDPKAQGTGLGPDDPAEVTGIGVPGLVEQMPVVRDLQQVGVSVGSEEDLSGGHLRDRMYRGETGPVRLRRGSPDGV